ncbi:hypothetical protein D3C76_1621940 [compost metagenome]
MYDCSNCGAVVVITAPVGVIGLPLDTSGGTLVELGDTIPGIGDMAGIPLPIL